MTGERSVRATEPEALAAVLDAVRDFRFPLSAVRVDERTRTVRLPFERKHPHPEQWELVVRNARQAAVAGRVQQDTDYFRKLSLDPAGGVFTVEGVIVAVRIRVDALDVEARCLTPETKPGYDPADLPEPIRKEIDAWQSASLRGQESYAERDRERVIGVTAASGVAALVLGAGSTMPPLLLPVEAALGAGAGFVIARRRVGFPGATAAIFGIPVIGCSVLGILLTRGRADGNVAGLGQGAMWSLMAIVGALLGVLNRKMMDEVQGLVSLSESRATPPKPLDRRIPGRAAAIVGPGAGILLLVFGASWAVGGLMAPLGCGGAAWLLARFQARPFVAGRMLLLAGVVVAFAAIEEGAFIPAALLVALAHFPAGMMVAYYSRGEGPR